MVIKFTRDVSSLGMGKDFKKGQVVPPNFQNIQALLDDGIAVEDENVVKVEPIIVPKEMIEEYNRNLNETTIPSKASKIDSNKVTLDMLYLIQDMTYNELTELLRKEELKVSGSKEDKLQRLIDYYEGGGE